MNKQPVKVLHICQRDDSATGGAVRVAVEYITRLKHYGVEAHCLFLYGKPNDFQPQLAPFAHYLDIRNSNEVWKFTRLNKFIRKFAPDIIHHHDGLMWSNLITSIHPNYKKISHAHLSATVYTSPIKGKVAAWIRRRSTNALVCITDFIQADYVNSGRYKQETTHVISNGVDANRFQPVSTELKRAAKKSFGWDTDTPVIGYVGRLDCQTKGVDDFIRVLAELPENIKGLIVGDGPDRAELVALAQQYCLSDRIRFTGNLSEPYQAYCAMDVFCSTSHYEGFGLSVIEAMSCEIPVVGFVCEGGINEVLNETTGDVVDRDPLKMAKAISNILDAGLSQSKLDNIRAKIKTDYCWEKNAEKLATLYQDIIQ